LDVNPATSSLSQGAGCADSLCATEIYSLAAPAPVSGSIALSGNTLNFSIDLAAASFDGPDGAVSSVDFSNVNYSGSVTLSPSVGSNYSVDGGQMASITGTLTPIGAGSQTAINATMALVTGTCTGDASSLVCGLIFGAVADFNADVNGNERWFRHTVNALSVPEPGTAILIAGGLAVLASRRRLASA
jgi:hypothetical protein